ncbi:MAG: carboxymuconolactone decarboxylase family protein [Dokdonella sp.]
MTLRIDYPNVAPGALQAMLGVENYVRASGLDDSLLELIKTRVSQINGCAYCLDMHTRDARAAGETEQRLHVLAAWREANLYSDRERAALALAEAVTLVASHDVNDDIYSEVRRHFDAKDCVNLIMAIIAINGWNRLAVSLRLPIPVAKPAA